MSQHRAAEPEPDHVHVHVHGHGHGHGLPAAAPRLSARDFDPAVLSLFDRYVHGLIDRRGFLDGAARYAGVAGAAALLTALSPDFASSGSGSFGVRPEIANPMGLVPTGLRCSAEL